MVRENHGLPRQVRRKGKRRDGHEGHDPSGIDGGFGYLKINENSEVTKLLLMKSPGFPRGLDCGRMKNKTIGGEEAEEPYFVLTGLFSCSLCPSSPLLLPFLHVANPCFKKKKIQLKFTLSVKEYN